MSSLRGTLKQPFLYFAVLGAAIFWIDARLRQASERITVSDAVVGEVAAQLEQTLKRPPSDDELRQGVEGWIDTELLFREATALGLQENDAVIRDHLARKLRHVVRERSIFDTPADAELKAQLESDPARYTLADTFDLTHVFLRKSTNETAHRARVDAALSRLEGGAAPASVGDTFPRGPTFTRTTRELLEEIFGTQLSAALEPSQLHHWQQLSSRRGAHLIRLDAINTGKPDFEALRPSLIADVQERRKQAAVSAFTDQLREKYDVETAAPR